MYAAARQPIRRVTPSDTPTPIPTFAVCDGPRLTASEATLGGVAVRGSTLAVESELVIVVSGKIHPFNGIPLRVS
jgi:hypothetical protein